MSEGKYNSGPMNLVKDINIHDEKMRRGLLHII